MLRAGQDFALTEVTLGIYCPAVWEHRICQGLWANAGPRRSYLPASRFTANQAFEVGRH